MKTKLASTSEGPLIDATWSKWINLKCAAFWRWTWADGKNTRNGNYEECFQLARPHLNPRKDISMDYVLRLRQRTKLQINAMHDENDETWRTKRKKKSQDSRNNNNETSTQSSC
ncbi:hypothetical protein AAMO2058_000876500 [Amorphochlora amoebiformis]